MNKIANFKTTIALIFVMVAFLMVSCGSGNSSNSSSSNPVESNFIIVGKQGTILNYNSSSNQITDVSESTLTNEFNGVAYGDNTLVIIGTEAKSAYIFTRKNGRWVIESENSIHMNPYDVIYHGSKFVVGGFHFIGPEIQTSIDGGKTWQVASPTIDLLLSYISSISYGAGKYVSWAQLMIESSDASLGWGLTSIDGESWSYNSHNQILIKGKHLNRLTYGNNKFVGVGMNGVIVTTLDGESWVEESPIATNKSLYGVTYGKGKYVAVGESGTIISSNDGKSWELESAVTSNSLNKVAYGDGQFIAVGINGTIITSKDAKSWHVLPIIKNVDYNDVVFISSN